MVRAMLVAILAITVVFVACANATLIIDDDSSEEVLDASDRTCNEAEPSPPEVEGETFTTAGGVEVTIIDSGEEDPAQPGDAVAVHYAGWLTADGTLFDSSLIRCEPFTFVIDRGDVIRGWDEGIVGMSPGDIRRLIIPADLAYGDQARDNIPPNSSLTFDVELLAFGRAIAKTPTP